MSDLQPGGGPTSPRIRRIELSGIGPFDDATFDLPEPTDDGELVLFEGPNGSGKTTILEAIAVLVSGARGSPGYEAGLLPPLGSFGRRARTEAAQVKLMLGSSDGLFRAKENTVTWEGDANLLATLGQPTDAAENDKPTSWAAFAFRGSHVTANLETPGPKRINRPALRGALSFGEAFPASAELGQVLVNLKYDLLLANDAAGTAGEASKQEELAQRVESRRGSIRRFEEGLSEILQRKVTIDFPPDQLPPEVRLDGELIPIDLLGEGFRRSFAWMSDLIARLERTPWADKSRSPFHQDFWLLLDEVDQSLHPEMQRRILPVLRKLFPRARIYASTHSPIVVASAPSGCVFPIRPDPRTHRVSGVVEPVGLGPGHSLTWAVEEIFGVPSPFVDQETIDLLQQHRERVDQLRRGELEGFDWKAFAELRAPLVTPDGEARTVVALREAPVRRSIDEHLRELASAAE